MGAKNTKVGESGFALGGPQDFQYDSHKAVFEEENGLLFRLVNSADHQWAFYNDTKKYEFHVTVTFGPQSSNLVPLGKTSLAELPEGGWSAKTIVYPGLTEPFIQGEVRGFDSVVHCVMLTNEYKEKRREEKKEAKAAAKRAKKGEANPVEEDELGSGDDRR